MPSPSPRPPPADAATLADAPVSAITLPARGEACSDERACADGLRCAPLPGGYCTSACSDSPCDGACVETARAGELCMRGCRADADCRADEGYVCDPTWRACLLPNLAAIVPTTCPTTGPVRDTAFGASEAWSTSRTPGLYQLEPSSVVTSDGGVTALYMSRGAMSAGNALAISRVDGKGTTSLEVPLSSVRANHFDPWLARDRKGTLYAVWLGFDSQVGRQEIAMATSGDSGATWSTPVAVHDPADCPEGTRDCLDKPMVVIGPDPKQPARDIVYVLYAGADGGLRVRASRDDSGTTFSPPVTATIGVYGNATVGSDGRLHVLTLNGSPMGAFGSANHAIEYASSADGGATFSQPVRVSGHEELLPFFFANPSIAVDTRRKWLYAVYVRGGRDARWEVVLATSKDGGASWKRTRLAGDGCAIHMVPNVALDPTTGTLHVAYYDSAAAPAPGRFVHASCQVGGVRCKIHGAINSVPFAALSTVRHSPRWIGEYQSLVVDARRRLLHAVWSQVVDEGEAGQGRTRAARIFHSSAKLK